MHAVIHPDSSAVVTETILADFSGEYRHGIYRDIPIHYTDRAGQHFKMRLRIQAVLDGDGRNLPYKLQSAGRYLRVRIGEANTLVTGKHTYWIRYQVERGAVRFFPEHDEFYWNLTGNEWAVPMRRVHSEIELPESVKDLRAIAFSGVYGSTFQLTPSVIKNHILIDPGRPFDPYEGLTVAAAWAKGATKEPSAKKNLAWWLEDNWIYGVPLAVLAVMTLVWYEKGRDPVLHHSETVEYEPPDGLTPAEMGTLFDQKSDIRDITSTVIDLAVRGYMRIEPLETTTVLGKRQVSDYQLSGLKSWRGDHALKAHETALLEGIFGKPETSVKLSDLEEVFYEKLSDIRDDLYAGLIKAGYLDGNPEKIRTGFFVGGVVLTVFLVILFQILAKNFYTGQNPAMISAVLSGAIVMAFSPFMPRRTIRGAAANDKVAGFREFLRRTDQDRVRRINDPKLFERCLPYALAFGVADYWARAFVGLYKEPPAWYAGNWDTFSPRVLSHDLNRSMASMGSTFTSQPRSSGSSSSWGGSGFGGGGFSGGGGGGGGGGSW